MAGSSACLVISSLLGFGCHCHWCLNTSVSHHCITAPKTCTADAVCPLVIIRDLCWLKPWGKAFKKVTKDHTPPWDYIDGSPFLWKQIPSSFFMSTWSREGKHHWKKGRLSPCACVLQGGISNGILNVRVVAKMPSLHSPSPWVPTGLCSSLWNNRGCCTESSWRTLDYGKHHDGPLSLLFPSALCIWGG